MLGGDLECCDTEGVAFVLDGVRDGGSWEGCGDVLEEFVVLFKLNYDEGTYYCWSC